MVRRNVLPPRPSRDSRPFRVERGLPLPLGVSRRDNGFNFTIFSRHGTRVWLEFYATYDAGTPTHRFELTPERHRTGDIWHIWIGGVEPGQLYGYRIDGPYEPFVGHRYNRYKLLLDPRATAITHMRNWDFRRATGYIIDSPVKDLSFSTEDNAAFTPKCVVTADGLDRERPRHPRRSWSETVIYEVHVRGFTIHPTSGVSEPGTYQGLIDKIPYLQDLGITAVELMPVQEFNENGLDRINPLTGERLTDYWGYNPTAYLAPNGAYSSSGTHGEQIDEFRRMVQALHDAGIEVILDIVLNHTAEGNQFGPTFNGRGIDNRVFYMLAENLRYYRDFTGTGNTVNANHPVVRDFIMDGLRYWTVTMHVDGFRFDLASVLGRDPSGTIMADPPLLERIAQDPILRDVKLIAEAWDAAGAYQVGEFGPRWAEWNNRFRDDVRRYWRGDQNMRGQFANRLTGSADIYAASGRTPASSINYVTAHDGFTLNDVVSYERKHNEANGEQNLDGMFENFSANYGIEGPTNDPVIEETRRRQIKNLLLTLFISRGVPLMLGGDEFRRTQMGNNNAYAQDNEISWFDWDFLDEHREIHRFTRLAIAFRRQYPVLRREAFYTLEELRWFEPEGTSPPNWANGTLHALACMITDDTPSVIYMIFNPIPQQREFVMPPAPGGRVWYRRVDTAQPSPADILEQGREELLTDQRFYVAQSHSSVILLAK